MTRSQIFLAATFTLALVCAATWLALSSAPGTTPDVIDAAVTRTAPSPGPVPVVAPASSSAQ